MKNQSHIFLEDNKSLIQSEAEKRARMEGDDSLGGDAEQMECHAQTDAQECMDDVIAGLLREKALSLGAYRAEFVKVKDISMDSSFRKLCESNVCGNYGQNYTCPPDAGDINELMEKIKTFDKALVYQTVSELEDSYDFEGMMAASASHNQLLQALWDYTDELHLEGILHLGAGGCHLCSVCGKRTGTPCPDPARAVVSLETHGINVSLLAQQAGMRYINGKNTVTYFGAVFIH